jgi:hypothetical protein
MLANYRREAVRPTEVTDQIRRVNVLWKTVVSTRQPRDGFTPAVAQSKRLRLLLAAAQARVGSAVVDDVAERRCCVIQVVYDYVFETLCSCRAAIGRLLTNRIVSVYEAEAQAPA